MDDLKREVEALYQSHEALTDRVDALEAKVDALDARHEHTRGVVNRNSERFLSAVNALTLVVKGKK